MKRLVSLAGALALAGAPFATSAAPAAPSFNQTVRSIKVSDGFSFQSNGGRQLIVSGNLVYVAFGNLLGEPTIARSSDGGATFPTFVSMVSDPADPADGQSIRIALAADPLQPGKKILFAAWATQGGQIRSSYHAERPDYTGWSVPVAIVGSGVWGHTLSVGAAPNGSIHVMFDQDDGAGMVETRYMTAPDATAPFGEVAPTPWRGGDTSMAFDLFSNVYVVSSSGNADQTGRDLLFHRKAPTGHDWTTMTLLTSSETVGIGDNVSIAVADPSAVYIAYKRHWTDDPNPGNHVHLASSTDGGATWTFRPVTPNATVYGTHPSVAVSTLNGVRTVTVAAHYVNYGPDGRVSVNKTTDGGLTWSNNASINGVLQVSLALDERGKALISYAAEYLQPGDEAFATGSAYQNGRAIFFSRER